MTAANVALLWLGLLAVGQILFALGLRFMAKPKMTGVKWKCGICEAEKSYSCDPSKHC